MHALEKKLLRDFRRLWLQALAIGLVLACGVAILITSFGMYRALDETRQAYYERNRFADVFMQTRRAPLSLLPEVLALPGIWAAEPRVSASAVLDIPGYAGTATGQILSLPVTGEPLLNVPLLRSGRLPDPEAADEVMVNAPFAEANGFRPGDTLQVNLNGRKRVLKITGTALSPEFIYTIGPGALMPDNRSFGILWMPGRAAAAAFDMTGAFNDLSVKLTPGTQPEPVLDALDSLLEPYGGLGAYARAQQVSHSFIDAEIKQLRSTGAVLPPVFFGISAFLVGMVLGRIVMLERAEIGLLKAVGYSDLEICVHYLALAALIALCGTGIGWIAGGWMAHGLAVLYAEFFNFPYLIFRVPLWVYALSGLLAVLATVIGAARAALRAARLAPAVAMQPPAPPHFRRGLMDRLFTRLRLSQPTVMILRSLLRWPLRSAMTVLGLALAVASVVSAGFFQDALDAIVDQAFYQSNRQDAMLLFSQDLPESALLEVRRLPGVLQAEGQQFHAAILRHGPHEKRVSVEARRPGTDLSRVIGTDGAPLTVPPGGIVLSERLAQQLEAGPGTLIEAEFLSGRRGTYPVTVSAVVEQYFGLGAYVDLGYLNTLFRQSPRITVANVALDEAQLPQLNAAVKDLPGLAGTIMMTDTRRGFEDTIAENVVIMNSIYITIAVLITVGVAYNGARIQLSERARELASLRILGFSRGEVSYILVGETMLLALVAQPVGWLTGYLLALSMTQGFSSDLYVIPLVMKPATYATASLVVLGASLAAALLVRRRLDRLDLVAVMKTRE